MPSSPVPALFDIDPVAAMRWQRQWLWLFASGAAVLLAGLLLQQRDGKMLTYTALALVVGAMQTWLLRRGHAKSK